LITKVVFFHEHEGKKYCIELTTKQFEVLLKHCKDWNDVMQFFDALGKWKEIKYHDQIGEGVVKIE